MKIKLLFITLVSALLLNQCSKKDLVASIAPAEANNKGVGASAKDILSAQTFTTLQIEIVFMPGHAPDVTALNNLGSFLNMLINKPGGVQITQRVIPASGKTTLTLDEIKAIEKANRTTFNNGSNLSLFIIYVDADYSTANIVGTVYRNTSMVIFKKTIKNNSGGINQASQTKLETTVLEHEFGHLMGLVNLGSPMQTNHVDAANDKHCDNRACLMYFSTQSGMMGGILISGPVPEMDANCRNDMRANGGK